MFRKELDTPFGPTHFSLYRCGNWRGISDRRRDMPRPCIVGDRARIRTQAFCLAIQRS